MTAQREASTAGHRWDLDDYSPPECEPPHTIGERLAPLTRAVTQTPFGAAIGTLALVATVAGVMALRPVTVVGADQAGPYVAHCGIWYYAFGHPNPAVRQSCATSFDGHASVFLATALVLVLLLIAAVLTAGVGAPAGSRLKRLTRSIVGTPPTAGLAALTLAAVVVGLAALRTVPVHLSDAAGPLVAHCGLGYYLHGAADRSVDDACHQAFAGHATLALLCAVVAVGAVVAIALFNVLRPESVQALSNGEYSATTAAGDR